MERHKNGSPLFIYPLFLGILFACMAYFCWGGLFKETHTAKSDVHWADDRAITDENLEQGLRLFAEDHHGQKARIGIRGKVVGCLSQDNLDAPDTGYCHVKRIVEKADPIKGEYVTESTSESKLMIETYPGHGLSIEWKPQGAIRDLLNLHSEPVDTENLSQFIEATSNKSCKGGVCTTTWKIDESKIKDVALIYTFNKVFFVGSTLSVANSEQVQVVPYDGDGIFVFVLWASPWFFICASVFMFALLPLAVMLDLVDVQKAKWILQD